MLLLIDNYDSFTYNLVQCFQALGEQVHVVRNDSLSAEQIESLHPHRVVISPGPGGPSSAGVSVEVIRRFRGRVPLLGVCLGHQAIAHAAGADIVRAPRVMHGKVSEIVHDGTGVYRGVSASFEATRYHSLMIREDSLPSDLRVTARAADDGVVMGVADDRDRVFGMQYHPESILTPEGLTLLRAFLEVV